MTQRLHILLALVSFSALALQATVAAVHVQAQPPVRVSMTANRSDLAIGDNVMVQITVQAQSTSQGEIQLPAFDGFQIVQRSVERPMQFSFGFGQQAPVVTSSTTYKLVLMPTAVGRFRFAPVKVTFDGKVYQSEPLTLSVQAGAAAQGGSQPAPGVPGQAPGADPLQPTAADPSAQPQVQAQSPSAAGDVAVFDDNAFLRTVVDKTEPYEGEQVTVTIYLYTRRNLQQVPAVQAEASTDGFWTHDLLSPQRALEPTRQVVNNRAYWVYVLRRFAAFPLKSGELTIGAMALMISRESIFDIFNQGQAQANLTRSGVPLLLRVKPLPAEGRPAGDVAVGSFELSAVLDRNQAMTGDAVTLTATVRGKGNVTAVRVPNPSIAGLDVLQPETHELIESPGDLVQGTRSFAWLMVPRTPGTHAIPALTLETFDPTDGKYHRVSSAPLTLTAAGNAQPGVAAAADAPAQAGDADIAAEQEQWPPPRARSALARKQPALAARSFYPWALGAGPGLWLLSLIVPALQQRARARRNEGGPRAALRDARARLSGASAALREKDARRFHAEITSALTALLAARCGVSITGLTRPQLRALLSEHAIPEDPARTLIDVLERCDVARFSPAQSSEAEMQSTLGHTEKLFASLQDKS